MDNYRSDVRVICCTLAGSEYTVQNNNIYKISGVKIGLGMVMDSNAVMAF